MNTDGYGRKEAQCVGKERFATYYDANLNMSRQKQRYKSTVHHRMKPNLNVYRCQYCEGWHIGVKARDKDCRKSNEV